MRFEFSCKKTDGGISFEATGCGLAYNYDGRTLTLDVLHLSIHRPLLLLDLGPIFPRNPLIYAEFIEKAAQINALLYSSNQTLNLCETIHIEKLIPVICEISKTAELAHDIEMKNYERFSESIANTYELQTFSLNHHGSLTSRENAYKLTLKTSRGNEIQATGPTAKSVISKIAEHALRDIIALEFTLLSGQNAQYLIALSARLSTVARLLDMNFDPNDKLLLSKDNTRKNKIEKSLQQ